jgi:hypothetical protein
VTVTVACVLKSGPEYRVEHVQMLAAGVRRHLTLQHRFVCLTDLDPVDFDEGVEPRALHHGWPGWWSKIELFRPGLFDGPVFYADLDTIIVGSLDDLALGHRFTVLENFWSNKRIGSGLMAWNDDLSAIYERFARNAANFQREFVTTERWGDQGFIAAHAPFRPELWQLRHPGRVVSYKQHVVPAGRVPEHARVICYHGKPRPWDTALWQKQLNEETAE